MKHVLDNPAWNALISGNKHLALGNDFVKYFDTEASPFAAFQENTAESFQSLYELMPPNRPVLFVTPVEVEIPPMEGAQYYKRVSNGMRNTGSRTN